MLELGTIVELAKAGYKAGDILALNKQGFNKEVLTELLAADPEPEPEEAEPKNQETEEPLKPSESTGEAAGNINPALQELEKLKAELAAEKQKVEAMQKQNRQINNNDMPREDPTKNITELISSLM